MSKGTRVEIIPHYDLWMRGAQFGTVISFDSKKQQAKVKLDKWPTPKLFPIEDLTQR